MTKMEQFHLLLVEDNPGDADLAAERLSEMPDHEITVVNRLKRAVEVLEQSHIDAVILDLNLPDSSGIETFREVRRASATVAVVIYSGDNDPALKYQALKEGALDYIDKNAPSYGVHVRSLLYSIERFRAQSMQRQIEAVIAANPDAVFVTDPNFRVRFVNNAALDLLGREEDGLINQPLDFPLREGEVTEIELTRRDEPRRAEVRVAAIDWHGEPALLASVRDITDRRLIEEQLYQSQKMEAVGQLTGGMAHDINNLLQIIIVNAEVLAGGELPEAERSHARDILTAAERGADLTRSLLIFARRQTLTTKDVDVAEMLRRLDGLVQRTLGDNIEVSSRIETDLPMVRADGVQLESGILNLCINARDAMPDGGLLMLQAWPETIAEEYAPYWDGAAPGQYVCISVTDTGTGMPPEVVQKAFEPFYSTKPEGKGTGLGLSMVYGLMKQLGGGAKISSTTGEGTTITLFLPAVAVRQDDIQLGVAERKPAPGHERILLVEDNDLVRSSVQVLLGRLGYEVVAVVDANQALAHLEKDSKFDLLFSDVILPGGMSGRQLAYEVRKRWPSIRALFSSGYTDPEELRVREGEEPLELLVKPYRQDDLATRIRDILDR